jgi:hypothetical protein
MYGERREFGYTAKLEVELDKAAVPMLNAVLKTMLRAWPPVERPGEREFCQWPSLKRI